MLGGKTKGRRHLLPHSRDARSLDPDLPTFVDRDKGPEIRGWLREARNTGGFLVLVGDSSVGKTRLLYEAARDAVPDFEVLAPDLGDGALVNKIAEATFPLPRLIVWLDELQRFLDGPYLTRDSTPITSATIRLLLGAPAPVIILGTLWPAYASQLRATEPDTATGQQRPRYPNTLDILAAPRLRYVPLRTFSPGEKKAAEELASQDPWLAEAVADPDYGVTEFLAGAPELMRRYEQATEEQRAVLHAAIDARRVGIEAPLPEQLLRAAARGYLSTVHPDDTWFGPAMDELTSARRPQDRATAPLIPVPNADHTQVLGFTVADYLLQHLTRRRRSVRLPAVTWQALIDHTHDEEDLLGVGNAADRRLLYGYAELAYLRIAEAADAIDVRGTRPLAELLYRQGRADELRVRADAGDSDATDYLNSLLREEEHVDETRAYVDVGAPAAFLASLLTQRGRAGEAMEMLRARADAGDLSAVFRLAQLPAGQDRVGEAIEMLRAHADAGDYVAAIRLAELLLSQGEDELRARADAGDWYSAYRLAELLASQGRKDELRARADVDGDPAASRLDELLVSQGRKDELRARADAGDTYAAGLVAKPRHEDEMRAHADAGDRLSSMLLAGLLVSQGREDELRARADAGDISAAIRLAELLASQGREDELRARADAGDGTAASRLAELLAEQGREDELRAEVDAGTSDAAERLMTMLAEKGDTTSADRMHRFGLQADGSMAGGGSPAI